jgi:hypothetical protein
MHHRIIGGDLKSVGLPAHTSKKTFFRLSKTHFPPKILVRWAFYLTLRRTASPTGDGFGAFEELFALAMQNVGHLWRVERATRADFARIVKTVKLAVLQVLAGGHVAR